MTTPEDLARIDFGRLDAESDPRLLDYFLVTGTVKAAEHGAKLVIGRKGSGKTALFTHLKHNLPTVTIDLDLFDYVFEVHKGLIEAGLTAERAYVASWKLLIYAAVFGALRDEMEATLRTRGDKAVEALGLGGNATRFHPILNWLKRVRRLDIPTVAGTGGGGLELGDDQSGVLTAETVRWLDELGSVLQAEVELNPVTVLIDRLDDAWDGSRESLHLLGGAIRATRDVAIAWGQPSPAPVITFLRTDLWEKLSFNDKNKMSQDIIYLDWTPEQLSEVVDLRVHNSLGTAVGTGWERAFTTEEMRQRAGARTYMTKRTMGRPRDIVAFAIFAKEAAVTSGHARIEAADIYEGEKKYSKHILGELRDEIERHVADYTAVTNSLKTIGKRNFAQDEWLTACERNGLAKDDAEQALDQLFEASAVGVHGAGGWRGGSGTTYRYQDRHLRSGPNAVLQVHLALVRELGLKDA